MNSGVTPDIGFDVLREGGHEVIWDQWRGFDVNTAQRNEFEGGLVGFTLFYTSENNLMIRWTSRSINMRNWTVDVAPETYTSIWSGETNSLRTPVIHSVEGATGLPVIYLPAGMSPPKIRP